MDKSLLFVPRLPEDDVEVPGIGTVRVRGLSRAEAMAVNGAKGTEATERRMLHFGLVDPQLSEAEAGRWMDAATAGELEPVSRRIAELSGMLAGSAKEAVKEFEANPDVEFRVLPGAEAGDDGGSAAGGDVS